MEPRFQRRVQRYGWDQAAHLYEQSWQTQLAEAQARLIVLATPLPGERVLEVACGTGLVTFPLAEKVGDSGSVLGTDLSQVMIETVRELAGKRGFSNTDFRRMGAEALELPDGEWDLAVCSLGLMYVPEPVVALGEMHRVLKPTGRVAVLVWGERRHCGWAEIFSIVDARVKSEVCPLFFQLGGKGVLEAVLQKAGFEGVTLQRLQTKLSFAGDEEACLAAFAGGPVALAYRNFDDTARREAHGAYLESIAPYKVGAGYKIPGEFVLATAHKPVTPAH